VIENARTPHSPNETSRKRRNKVGKMVCFRSKSGGLLAMAALFGAWGCTEGDSHLGGHGGDAGASPASGGSEAEGGAETGGSKTGGTGGSATGGSNPEGGTETGGREAQGGSQTGGKSARGGAEMGGSTGGSEAGGSSGGASGGRSGGASGSPSAGASGAGTCTPYKNPVCDGDADCDANEYCAKACAPSACGCSGGQLGCTADCRNLCKPLSTACTAAAPEFTEQLDGEHCTVLVRISADSTTIPGYVVNCGATKPFTEEDALNVLRPMSSINWSGATPVGKAESTGIYSFKVVFGEVLHTGFISASTGRLLMITDAPKDGSASSFRYAGPWGEGAELGTSCAPDSVQPAVVFGIDGTDFLPAAPGARLLKTGLLDALRAKFGRVAAVAITNRDPAQTESLVFVSAP
jgi:hypothetical protein